MILPPTLDQAVLTTALTYAASFSFGAIELMFETVPSKLKPSLFVGMTTVLGIAIYLALVSTNPWVVMLTTAVSLSTGITGGIGWTQKNVLGKPGTDVGTGA